MHKKVAIALIGLLIVILGVLIYGSFIYEPISLEQPSNYCERDEDCVAASCCHPTQCTTRAQAPACGDVLCTQVCVAGSLDCGAGYCGCINNRCAAVIESQTP